MNSRVSAIIVTYHPDSNELLSLIEQLLKQVSQVIIVDNTPDNKICDSAEFNSELIEIISCGKNLGIAHAHNLGIQFSIDNKFDYVLLMDQDSNPPENMVGTLINAIANTEQGGEKIAAAGPTTIDSRTGDADFFTQIKNGKVSLFSPKNASTDTVECEFVISSGCLIPIEVFRRVGKMEQALFIDCVDIEWGFRARAKGYKVLGVTTINMLHTIGTKHLKLGKRKLTMHAPLRHYYFFRNVYSLLFRRYIPISWKMHVLLRSSIQAVVFSTMSTQRWQHFSMISRGICHGIFGKLGKYEA